MIKTTQLFTKFIIGNFEQVSNVTQPGNTCLKWTLCSIDLVIVYLEQTHIMQELERACSKSTKGQSNKVNGPYSGIFTVDLKVH